MLPLVEIAILEKFLKTIFSSQEREKERVDCISTGRLIKECRLRILEEYEE